ncbi:HEAT repeat domain-containing protein [Uliginosibacterium sp. 31-16]|uniref:HEAT repeat domain-containing protein n=1 Tax=Uliginosibacterium sp. 31-16 TaxID=3068315 RepID=UPI00273E755C|nr:HEAT repeat domain-containing protein [Uliginosibacterium sp. 31-16]MDP5241096.1 HEAT repeat domain-containing protein [Uliginosibacterium sp. 31-16]
MDEALLQRVCATQHGFLEIQKVADEIHASHSAADVFRLATELFVAADYPVRSLATFLFGRLAATQPESLRFLRERVSRDADWRVQEILAKAFDRYCADTGYEAALPVIRDWLADPLANVRRAVTEGLRIWTGRPYFKTHPEVAIALLAALREDDSEYVRKSVGNALRDISKKHGALIRAELHSWDTGNRRVAQTCKLASRFLDSPKSRE